MYAIDSARYSFYTYKYNSNKDYANIIDTTYTYLITIRYLTEKITIHGIYIVTRQIYRFPSPCIDHESEKRLADLHS